MFITDKQREKLKLISSIISELNQQFYRQNAAFIRDDEKKSVIKYDIKK